MTESEVRKYCVFLLDQLSAKDKILGELLNEVRELRKENTSRDKNLYAMISSLEAKVANYEVQLSGYQTESNALKKERNELFDRLSVLSGDHFGSSKTQKGVIKKSISKDRNDDKG